MSDHQKITQAVLDAREAPVENKTIEKMAIFTPAGNLLAVIGGVLAGPPAHVTATAIGTAAKTVATDEPTANSLISIKFTNGNNAAAPTVAFNGGTARAVQLGGSTPAAGEITLAANGVAMFLFDGTILHQIGVYS